VRKTSLYLPDGLKEELAALARRSGRSEAELVRSAVEQLVRAARARPTAPPPEPAFPAGPSLVGVGLGPSDPDLVTERARQVLRAADRVFAASTAPDAIGRAEAIVRAVTPDVPVDRLVIDIAGSPAQRSRSMEDAAATVLDALGAGAAVAFVTLGDPNVYSTFPALARLVAGAGADVPITTVPGVMAFQELAARTGTVLAEGDEHLTLVALGDDVGCLDGALDDRRGTLVVYKGGRRLPDLARRLAALDRLDGAVVGELLGLPGGRSVPVAAVADRPASYLATVIVPAVRDGSRFVGDGGP
jgi:precorrin-2/cobalt-factor-2 C20-methyltransferase